MHVSEIDSVSIEQRYGERKITMLEKTKIITKQRAQGIVEYALILAFVVSVIGFFNSSLLDTVKDVYYDVADYLAFRTYNEYYGEWHNLSKSDLAAISNDKRKKADQEGLQALVHKLIGLNKEDALAELQKLMPDATENDVKPDANGNSKTLTLLTYWEHYEANPPYVTLGNDANMNAVAYVTNGQATMYGWHAADNNIKYDRTVSVDRVFFSNDMSGNTNQRTIAAQLHYDSTGTKVESVSVVAHKGDKNGEAAEGLNITVTGSGWRGFSAN